MRSSSPADFTNRQPVRLLEIRELGNELQLAGLKRCRETCHESNAERNWNDLEIVTTSKDTPICYCSDNQQGNLRNEGRPHAGKTGRAQAGDKSTGSRYRGHPTSMADGVRRRAWIS